MSAIENPYVAIVARKHRNLRKKLEKILKLEANVASGKVLDEEQLILYSSKGSVEKAIADIGALKDQLEEVYVQEVEASNAAKEDTVHAPSRTEEVSTETPAIAQSSTSTQCEETPKVQVAETASQIETPVQDAPVTVVVDAIAQVEQAVRKLLKVFHVCMKYGSITGQPLPANVDFFGKTLLGQTSIAGFDVALEGSLRTLGIYLNEELAPQSEFVRGFTYSQMSDFVDALAYDCTPVAAAAHSFVSLSVSPPPAGAASIMSVVDSPVVVDEPLQQAEDEAPSAVAESSEARSDEVPLAQPAVKRETERKRKATPRERLPRVAPEENSTELPSSEAARGGAEKKRAPRDRAPKAKKEAIAGESSTPSVVPAAPVAASSPKIAEKKPAWGGAGAKAERHIAEGHSSTERPVLEKSHRAPRKETTQAGSDGDKRKKASRERRPEERKESASAGARRAGDGKRSSVAHDIAQPKSDSKAPAVAVGGAHPSGSAGDRLKPIVRNVAGAGTVQGGPSRSQRTQKPQTAVGGTRAPPREPRAPTAPSSAPQTHASATKK